MSEMTEESSMPRISIITPVYNSYRYLEELIHSVSRQSWPHREHIIVNDGSDDDGRSVSLLKKHSEKIIWWSKPNEGQATTINKAFSRATGSIVCIINADDFVYERDVFERVAEIFQKNPDSAIVYGKTRLVDDQSRP